MFKVAALPRMIPKNGYRFSEKIVRPIKVAGFFYGS
jgi:hypothetical protein